MKTLGEAAVRVLLTADPVEKAAQSIIAATEWRDGNLAFVCQITPPDRPARPPKPELLPPKNMPKRRKAGTKSTRIALLHAITHIEFNAIDLAWDIIARFGNGMAKKFLDDWVGVGADEARHFTLLQARLKDLGAAYGDLPAHDGLWQAAEQTANDILARLAIVPLVLEARGLDVTPNMVKQLQKAGDEKSAAVLQTVFEEEIAHVKAGAKWFIFICEQRNLDPETTWQELVNKHFKGILKPPFNDEARARAGLPKSFYQPLAGKKS